MKRVNLQSLSKDQYSKLLGVINDVAEKAIRATEGLNRPKDILEAALDTSWQTNIPASLVETVNNNTGTNTLPSVEEEKFNREKDEFIELKDPFLPRLYMSWLRMVKNRNLNPLGEWFAINREYDAFLAENNLLDFLPALNQSEVDYHTKESKRYGFRQKYSKLIPEFVAHGVSPALHVWNSRDQVCEPLAVGSRNFGIYPITDDFKRVSRVYKYVVPYFDFLKDPLLDHQLTKYVEPMMESMGQDYGTSEKRTNDNYKAEYGVRLTRVIMPHLYIPKDGDYEEVLIEKPMFIVAKSPNLKRSFVEDQANNGFTDLILGAFKEVSDEEAGDVVINFNDTFPGDWPGKGPLMSFLHDQAHLNLLKQSQVRLVQMLTDPSYTEEDLDGVDDEYTETETLIPGKRYKNKEIKLIVPTELVAGLNSLIQTKKIIQEDAEQRDGMNKIMQGMQLPGRRSAEEVSSITENSSEAVQDVVYQFDDQGLKPSHLYRTVHRKRAMEDELFAKLELDYNDDNDIEFFQKALNEDVEFISDVLKECTFYQKVKSWSQIELRYRDFYKDYEDRFEDEQQAELQFQILENNLLELDKALEEMQIQMSSVQDPNQAAMLDQQSQDALLQREMLVEEMRIIKDSLQGLEEIPEASDWLYFRMLTTPVSQSDIEAVAGTATAKKKDERETFDLMKAYMAEIPEFKMMTDPKKVVSQVCRILKIKPQDVLKDPSKLMKIEKMLYKQQEAMLSGGMQNEPVQ
jgi:hypothetical protein